MKPTKSNRMLKREMIKLMEFWNEWLESGKSFEELVIMIDILTAGGAMPEREREVSHKVLELLRRAREARTGRYWVMSFIRETKRKLDALDAPTGEAMTQLFFSFA
jgi:hypothetical protein